MVIPWLAALMLALVGGLGLTGHDHNIMERREVGVMRALSLGWQYPADIPD
jgi:hypothetical protein